MKAYIFYRQVELEVLSELNQIEITAVTEEQSPHQGSLPLISSSQFIKLCYSYNAFGRNERW